MRAKAVLAAGVMAGIITLGAPQGLAQDNLRYVRDWLSIPLRETTNPDSAIIHKGVVSGARLTLLQTDDKAGVARVRTEDGIEGWIPVRYISSEPGARTQLDKTNAELEQLKKLNEQLRAGAPSIAALQDSSARQLGEAQALNSKLGAELDVLKRSAGDSTRLAQEHTALSKHAEELQTEATRLNTEITELRAGKQQQYFRDGALAVIGGALLTLIAARLWPRKRRSDWA